MNADREHAQQLLNYLAPDQVAAVVHVMEVMLDPLSRKLANAPLEDEEISEEEECAVAEAREWLKHNKPIPPAGSPVRVRLDDGRLGHHGQDPAARGKRHGELVRAPPLPIEPIRPSLRFAACVRSHAFWNRNKACVPRTTASCSATTATASKSPASAIGKTLIAELLLSAAESRRGG
jgi:hypothetical protein